MRFKVVRDYSRQSPMLGVLQTVVVKDKTYEWQLASFAMPPQHQGEMLHQAAVMNQASRLLELVMTVHDSLSPELQQRVDSIAHEIEREMRA